jgi:hypothetical protein
MPPSRHLINIAHFSKLSSAVERRRNGANNRRGGSVADRAALRSIPIIQRRGRYPQTVVQTCVVHLIRNSLAFVSWNDRKTILPAIKAIYRAENADMALVRLRSFYFARRVAPPAQQRLKLIPFRLA